MAEHHFSIPAHFTMVIRSLGALEGTVIKVDPEFKVVARAYPHVVAQLIRDRSPDMRAILSSLVLTPEGAVRWRRLERLLLQPAEAKGSDSSENHGLSGNGHGTNTRSSGSMTGIPPPSATAVLNPEDMVAAASDALDFLLSSKGSKVRTELVADTITFTTTVADESVQSMTNSGEGSP